MARRRRAAARARYRQCADTKTAATQRGYPMPRASSGVRRVFRQQLLDAPPVLIAPIAERHQRMRKAMTERRHLVVDARRHFPIIAPRQHAVVGQLAQTLYQHLLADAAD